ncbi:MAG: succinate--CoA ligase subunit beta [Clostridiales bacterium]|nr:succinate--CoA ligase subunit beta [Clostridiales bacterium]
MDLMEYKAKELFTACGIDAGQGVVIRSPAELDALIADIPFPAVVKAQVPVGGRGKAGGIAFAANTEELRERCVSILGMTIRGHVVDRVLITGRVECAAEWYLSILLDRTAKRPVTIFSPEGGVDIEQTARTAPERVARLAIDPLLGVRDYHARYLLTSTGAHGDPAALLSVLRRLYDVFIRYDCTLCEINPLAVTAGGSLIALDGKITVDDNALFRQPEVTAYRDSLAEDPFVLAARSFNFLYIPCDAAGSVAVMSNGSGMIMSCIDSLSDRGLRVRAALDLGGGATADRIARGVSLLLDDERTRALFINIFGGITRCDEVARGVAGALAKRPGDGRPVIVRFEGTNKREGVAILGEIPGVRYVEGLSQGVDALCERRSAL